MTWTPSPPVCGIRRAWLTLGAASVLLDNPAGGWFVTSMDLGYPAVRAVITDRPDSDGADDRTKYFGARTISVAITTLLGAGAQVDAVASAFAPFMVPSARPVFHFVLDRPGATERVVTVRPAGYAWAVAGADERDIQLQFVAADPAFSDPATQTAVTAWTGGAGGGRPYNLTYPRTYPAGGGAPTSALIASHGDLPVQPFLRIYGPVTGPDIQFVPTTGATVHVRFLSSFNIGAGHYVDVDTRAKTALQDGDPTQSVITGLDWVTTRWPVLPVLPDQTTMTITGSNTTAVSQVQASWQDRYLS
jgi:hypothetical protein